MTAIRELDETYWFQETKHQPTCRRIGEHMQLVLETDLHYPIILSSDGRVMDGMHRVVKAFVLGHDIIKAVQFAEDPEPDYINVDLDSLSYDEEV